MDTYVRRNQGVVPPMIRLDKELPPEFNRGNAQSRQENHDNLLEYIIGRLDSDRGRRNMRLQRMADIDREVSTWQKLSQEDTQRKARKDSTGSGEAIHLNLPLTLTHLDDMVAFFAEVYAPNGGSFFQVPKNESLKASTALVTKMNEDAKKSKHYKQLCMTLRRLVKYNVGGFHVEWEDLENDQGLNNIESIDLYNLMWDTRVSDPSRICDRAEWAAMFDIVDEGFLQEQTEKGRYTGCGHVLPEPTNRTNFATAVIPTKKAVYYKVPPSEAKISLTDDKTGGRVDWAGYGAALKSDEGSEISGIERIQVYIRINPYQFNMVSKNPNKLTLYKVTILNGNRIVEVKPAFEQVDNEAELSRFYRQIPLFLGYLNIDDMGEATRSIAELMNPFGSYGSFLMNSTMDARRSAVHGFTVYDPNFVDLSTIPKGQTAARVPSKQPGRDVRTGITTTNSNVDTSGDMEALQQVLGIMDRLFPNSALPNQVAGIDRAVSSQVAAVMQGVSRRLHMLVKVMDDDVHGPARFQCYVNIVRNEAADVTGLTDSQVLTVLGSGLAQLNREFMSGQIKELLFAILQNQTAAAEVDIVGMMNWWSAFLTIPDSLEQFRRAPAQAQNPGAPPAAGAAPGVIPPTV